MFLQKHEDDIETMLLFPVQNVKRVIKMSKPQDRTLSLTFFPPKKTGGKKKRERGCLCLLAQHQTVLTFWSVLWQISLRTTRSKILYKNCLLTILARANRIPTAVVDEAGWQGADNVCFSLPCRWANYVIRWYCWMGLLLTSDSQSMRFKCHYWVSHPLLCNS